MFKRSKDPSIRGFRVRSFNRALMILSCILIICVFLSTLIIRSQYKRIIDSMTDYAECNKAIRDIKDTSSYLTNQARLFVINHDVKYINNYLKEINYFKKREVALNIVEMSHKFDSPDVNLRAAVSKSSLLETREIYAMRLVCDTNKVNPLDVPEQILSVALSENDTNLSDEEKLKLAVSLVFDDDYEDFSRSISQYTSVSLNELVYSYLDEQSYSDTRINRQFILLFSFLLSLLVFSIVLYLMVIIFILSPLYNHIGNIENNQKMNMQGAYELKYIAKAYNNLYERNAVTASVLKHKAEHDPLTGLINREAFNQIKEELSISEKPLAYLIIDIDFFKSINDEYGHLIGDDVLRNVSTHLQEQFRSSDYVARIGGDEFAVIMPDVTETSISNIRSKVKVLNNILKEEKDGMPPVSLSIGAAFSEQGFNEDLEKNADIALYKVKQNGRGNIAFFNKK